MRRIGRIVNLRSVMADGLPEREKQENRRVEPARTGSTNSLRFGVLSFLDQVEALFPGVLFKNRTFIGREIHDQIALTVER